MVNDYQLLSLVYAYLFAAMADYKHYQSVPRLKSTL